LRGSPTVGGPAFIASTPAPVAQAAQPADHELVVVEGLGQVEQLVHDLVVARARQVEALADGELLGAWLTPPTALKVQDRPLSVREGHSCQAALPAHAKQAPLFYTRSLPYGSLARVSNGRLADGPSDL